jgi:tryptophan 2,3-dioxygenase
MNNEEMEEFFIKAFESVKMSVKPDGMFFLTHYSAGFPKIMHLVGDAAFWTDKDAVIDESDALVAVIDAADDVGKKYVDLQVYKALRSEDYHSILNKIARMSGPASMKFKKSEIAAGLKENEKGKLNNFLQRMKNLKAIRSGDVPGEYIFNHRMVRLYIWLHASEKGKKIKNT